MKKLSINPKFGQYKVGDEILYHKPKALIRASETKQHVLWDFNTRHLASIDWSIEPEAGLMELYRLRAQQLREKYDWIRLECSGGADSTTVLYSFLLNGIHVDEIVFRYPGTGTDNSKDAAWNTSAENHISELDYAALPLFNWVKTHFPKTLAHVHDYSKSMLENKTLTEESWVYNCGHWMQPTWADKHNQIQSKIHRETSESGKSIGVVYGVDKPKLALINNHWFFYFTDIQGAFANPEVGDYTNITNEYFFWTPDFPEIMIKQGHVVKTWFEQPCNSHLKEIVQYPPKNPRDRSTYENIVKGIIYPQFDLSTWQSDKPRSNFYSEVDSWFFNNFKGTELYQGWQAGIDYLLDNLDPMYVEYEMGQPVGIKSLVCPYFYYIGTTTASPTNLAFTNRDHHSAHVANLSSYIKFVKHKKIVPASVFMDPTL